EGQIGGDRSGAAAGQCRAGRAGAGAGVEHGAPGERMGAHADQLGCDGSVDEGGARRPTPARRAVVVDAHGRTPGRARPWPRKATVTAFSHQASSSSPPSAFSQPNVAIMATV